MITCQSYYDLYRLECLESLCHHICNGSLGCPTTHESRVVKEGILFGDLNA